MDKKTKEIIKSAIMVVSHLIYPERKKVLRYRDILHEAKKQGLDVSRLMKMAKEELLEIDAILDSLQDAYDILEGEDA